MILYCDNITQNLERNGNWVACVKYLLEKWQINKDNKPLMLKLSVNSWYTLTLDGPELSLTKSETDFLSQTLFEVYRYFSDCLEADETCQWLFGYMMIVRTDLFLNLGLGYFEIEQKGNSLIEKASKSGNMFAQLIYATDHSAGKEIARCKSKVTEHLSEYFDEREAVDSYFIEIFTTDHS